jgi:putative hydrolase of the HAD superfamily
MPPLQKQAMLKAVLFDLDNTLVDRDRAFLECVRARFSDRAVQAQLIRLDQGGRGDRRRLFDFWAQHTEGLINQEAFGQFLAQRLQPDADLLDALRILSNRVKLGIITNGSGGTQRAKVKAAGLMGVIPPDRVWVSEEVGKAKPDPEIFLLACQALDESPAHCLFVGDQESDDEAGAKGAGMRSRRVNAVLSGETLNNLIREEQAR